MALFDNFLAGGKKAPEGGYNTTNSPYTQYGGKYYDMSNGDYTLPSGMTTPQWKNGAYGYWNPRTASFQAFGSQPTQVATPPTPGQQTRDKLMSETQAAMDEANRKNEERYQQALGNLEGVGTQQAADINTRFDSGSSAVNQSLINSGLSGTTVLPSMQRGVERERTGALGRLEAMLAREKNDIIVNRNDVGPDWQSYLDLMYKTGTGGNR